MTDAHEGHPVTPLAALWPGPFTPSQGRTYAALYHAGKRDLGSLTRSTPAELLEIRGFGNRGVEEVRQRLARLGLSLRGEEVAS